MPGLKRFIIFLSILTGILALAYGYTAYRLLPFSTMTNTLRFLAVTTVIICVLMGPLAQIVRIFYEESPLSDAISWVAYVSFGFFSLALSFVILRDLGLGAFDLLSTALESPGGVANLSLTRAGWVNGLNLTILGFTASLSLYGFFKARGTPAINRISVPIRNLPRELDGFTIAQISDLHVGPTIKEDFVRRVVEQANSLNPDLIAITGDLIDGSVARLRKHVAPLADLRSRCGTYYVTGNHEYYSGALQWIGECRRLGMTVLLNEHRIIDHNGAGIAVGGVTDYTAGSFISAHRSDPIQAFQGCQENIPRILLAHQPKSIFEARKADVDLQLSGHTHGGQYFPGNLFVPLQQPVVKGLHRFDKTRLFVSCGTGYWGPPLRIGTRAEIALIELKPE